MMDERTKQILADWENMLKQLGPKRTTKQRLAFSMDELKAMHEESKRGLEKIIKEAKEDE